MRLLKLLLVLLLGVTGGCDSSIEHVCFSPDGTKVAYVTSRSAFIGRYLGALVFSAESLSWCDADTPKIVHTKQIACDVCLFGVSFSESVASLMFAPDSKHLAVYTTEQRMLILDMATRKMWALRLPKGTIYRDRVTWASNVELVYITETGHGSGVNRISKLRIFRHNISRAGHNPVQIYHDEATDYYVHGSWSPNGRYLLFGRVRGRSTLLDTQTGKTLDFALADNSTLQETSWKRDSSVALCAVERTRPTELGSPPLRTLDVALDDSSLQQTSSKRDSSVALCAVERTRPTDLVSHPLGHDLFLVSALQWSVTEVGVGRADRRVGAYYSFAREWTADGVYVVDDSGWASCALIRPEPWAQIQLRHRLARTFMDPLFPRNVQPLPVRGWIWTSTLGGDYAVDYSGEKSILIAKGVAWAISPDGKRIAKVNDKGTVTVEETRFPRLSGVQSRVK